MSTTASTPRSEPRRPRQRPETSVLLAGEWRTPEFASALAAAKLQAAIVAATIDEACVQLASSEIVAELVLLAQPLLGGSRQQDVDRLQRQAPLARIVIVAGTWCEGEVRTGRPPTGAIRLYWYELAPWWQANHRRLAAGLAPTWSAPLDHPQAGRFAVKVATIQSLSPVVAIHADDYAVYECFAEAGLRAIWTRGAAVPAAGSGIFDGGQLSQREVERLAEFCRQIRGPVVALLDFPGLNTSR